MTLLTCVGQKRAESIWEVLVVIYIAPDKRTVGGEGPGVGGRHTHIMYGREAFYCTGALILAIGINRWVYGGSGEWGIHMH
jgi:hypothetical protein